MIKICYIIGQLSMHGAEKQLYELVKWLNRETFEPFVITLSEGGYWSGEIRKLGIPVIELRRKRKREMARLTGLAKLLREIKPVIVHTYLFSANTYGRLAALTVGVPIVIASERNLPEIGMDKRFYQIIIDRFLAVFSDATICNTSKASDILVKKYFFSRKKVFTIHNGIDPSQYQTCLQDKGMKSCVIGTVGRLCCQKNHRLFLDMARLIISRRKDLNPSFLIIGDGPLKSELMNYARDLGIEKRVTFAGERRDVGDFLGAMDVFVMTSEYEGLSNAIMESMSAGLPVVATDVGGNSELIVQGETGYLCPRNDAEALAAGVLRLIDNEHAADEMGRHGKKKIVEEFSIRKMVSRTEEVYRLLLAGKIKIGADGSTPRTEQL